MIEFEFPPLGDTGVGEPVYPPGAKSEDYTVGVRPVYWWEPEYANYGVLYQLDRPACAFRCHYPGGSTPCDRATADEFIEWVKAHTTRHALT